MPARPRRPPQGAEPLRNLEQPRRRRNPDPFGPGAGRPRKPRGAPVKVASEVWPAAELVEASAATVEALARLHTRDALTTLLLIAERGSDASRPSRRPLAPLAWLAPRALARALASLRGLTLVPCPRSVEKSRGQEVQANRWQGGLIKRLGSLAATGDLITRRKYFSGETSRGGAQSVRDKDDRRRRRHASGPTEEGEFKLTPKSSNWGGARFRASRDRVGRIRRRRPKGCDAAAMRATHAHARVMHVRRGDGGPRVRQRQVRARSFIRIHATIGHSAHNAGAEHCRLCRIPHTRGRTHEAMSACRRVGGPGPASSHWRSGALEMAAGDASASREPRSDRHPRRTGPTGAAGARHGEFILSFSGRRSSDASILLTPRRPRCDGSRSSATQLLDMPAQGPHVVAGHVWSAGIRVDQRPRHVGLSSTARMGGLSIAVMQCTPSAAGSLAAPPTVERSPQGA